MSDDHTRHRDDPGSGGRFRPRVKSEIEGPLEQTEDPTLSRVAEKATQNLPSTLAALRSSLEKGKRIVDMGRARFDADWLVQDAAINTVIQLAESVKRLPGSFRDEKVGMPWPQLIGMRNILTHDYVDVDLSTVWTVLRDKFPMVEHVVFTDDEGT